MASYWKSQPKKFCDVCKCWIADNRASIDFHEKGKSHQEKKNKQMMRLRKQGQKQHAINQKTESYLKQMERAALKQYAKDLKGSGVNVQEALANNKLQADSWKSKETATGRTYYWNSITEETSWNKPKHSLNIDKTKPIAPKGSPAETTSTCLDKEVSKEVSSKPMNYDTSNPLGKWTVVDTFSRENSDCGLVASQEVSAPKKLKFEEKTVESLQDDTGVQVSFKKSKQGRQSKSRNIRKREQND